MNDNLMQLVQLAYRGKRVMLYPYAYPVSVVVAAAGTATGNVQVTAGWDFILCRTIQHTTQTTLGTAATITTEVIPNAFIQLTDTTNQRSLFQNPVDLAAYFG